MELLKHTTGNKKAEKWISWSFASTISRLTSATSNFFSRKRRRVMKEEIEEQEEDKFFKILVSLHLLRYHTEHI